MPKVTVLLTSYNHAKYIRESIDSILAQTFRDFEFYILDDCSSDNSWDIIKSYDDPRIITIRHEHNTNLIIEPNLFSKFKGEYFAIAHCDDKWSPEKLEKQVDYLDAHPDIAACFTAVQLMDEKSRPFKDESHPYYNTFLAKNMTRQEWLREFFNNGNRLCHPSCMMRLDVQKKEKLYTLGIGALPDFYRWIKLCSKYEIYVINQKLTYFRVYINGENVSGTNYNNLIRCQNELFFLAGLFKNLCDEDLKVVFSDYYQKNSNEDFNRNNVLVRAFLTSSFKPFQLFGIQLGMTHLINAIKQNDEFFNIDEHKKIIELTGDKDIFGIIKADDILNSTLFWGDDLNFNMSNSCSKQVYLSEGSFKIKFDCHEINKRRFRFDPDIGKYRIFKNLHIYADNTEIKFQCYGEYEETDTTIFFYSANPMIVLDEIDFDFNTISVIGETSINCSLNVDGYHKKKDEKYDKAIAYLQDGFSKNKIRVKNIIRKFIRE